MVDLSGLQRQGMRRLAPSLRSEWYTLRHRVPESGVYRGHSCSCEVLRRAASHPELACLPGKFKVGVACE